MRLGPLVAISWPWKIAVLSVFALAQLIFYVLACIELYRSDWLPGLIACWAGLIAHTALIVGVSHWVGWKNTMYPLTLFSLAFGTFVLPVVIVGSFFMPLAFPFVVLLAPILSAILSVAGSAGVVYPLAYFDRKRSEYMRRHGLCEKCRYPLLNNKCPECGWVDSISIP